MPAMTIRILSDATHNALKARAKRNGRSAEAEVRAIIDAAVAPAEARGLGSLLAEIGAQAGGIELEIERDRTAREPLDFA